MVTNQKAYNEKQVVIDVLNPVFSRIDRPDLIAPFMNYKYEYFLKTRYSKKRMEKTIYLVRKDGIFLSGFVPRVIEVLESRGFQVDWSEQYKNPFCFDDSLKILGLEPRWYQKDIFESMMDLFRGYIVSPTGSGKTINEAMIIRACTGNSLLVVPTIAILNQTIASFKKWFPDDTIHIVNSTSKKIGKITIGIINSLVSHLKSIPKEFFDLVLIDECHRVSNFDGMYAKLLTHLECPNRYGFTASPPTTPMSKYALEGFIGEKIVEIKSTELIKQEFLARPHVKIDVVPDMSQAEKAKLKGKYKDVYRKGVVENIKRNILIVEHTKNKIRDGKTVLIMVEEKLHGNILLGMLDVLFPGVFVFLHGDIPGLEREAERSRFEHGERKGVIATRVWGEGVDIRSIGVVINAVGGESEIAAIQRFGRGLRVTDEKRTVDLVDFIDLNHPWFQKHSLKRIMYYSKWGWL